MKILRIFFSKNVNFFFFFQNFLKKNFTGFSLLGQETLDMGVFLYLMGSPDCEDLKKYIWIGLDRLGKVWIGLEMFGEVWIDLDRLERFEEVWRV